MSSRTERPMTAPTTMLDAARANVRVKIAAAWTAMMFVFAYIDLFSFYRADVPYTAMTCLCPTGTRHALVAHG